MRPLLLAALLLLLAPAAEARAALVRVVEGAGGAALLAGDRGARTCVAIGLDAPSEPDCGPLPVRAAQPRIVRHPGGGTGAWVGGIVTAGVAAVEVVSRAGAAVRVATVAGEAYRGRGAGRVRFFLAPGGDRPSHLRLLDAGVTVLAASSLREPDLGSDGGRRLAAGRGWRATLRVDRRLAPTPLAPERFEPVVCVGLESRASSGDTCFGPLDLAQGDVVTTEGCGAAREPLVAGVVSERIARVTLVAGDGTRLPLPLVAPPGGLPVGSRAFAGSARRRGAIRRLEVEDRAGRVRSVEQRRAPAPFCQGGITMGFAFERVGRGRGLVVEDRGDHLCVALGRLTPGLRDCALPPVLPQDVQAPLVHRGDGVTSVAVVVPTEVREVELALDRGERVRVPAKSAYPGRYREVTAIAHVELPGRRRVRHGRLLDAAGRTVAGFSGPDVAERTTRVLRRVPGPGADRVLALHRVRSPFGQATCVTLDRSDCLDPDEPAPIAAQVDCGPRGAAIWTVVPRRAALRVELADGRAVTPRPIRVPGGFALVTVIPTHVGVRAVRLGTERIPFPLSPPAQHCGYVARVSPTPA